MIADYGVPVVPFETAVGYRRVSEEDWDFRPDPAAPIAYVRLDASKASTLQELRQLEPRLQKEGFRALVLTVDPARRLANALGLEQFGNVETPVPAAAFAATGVEPRGELWAAMLDTKESWDALVLRHAPDEATAHKILENPLESTRTSIDFGRSMKGIRTLNPERARR